MEGGLFIHAQHGAREERRKWGGGWGKGRTWVWKRNLCIYMDPMYIVPMISSFYVLYMSICCRSGTYEGVHRRGIEETKSDTWSSGAKEEEKRRRELEGGRGKGQGTI